MKVLAPRMILSSGMLKKICGEAFFKKKVILLPNFAVEKSMCLISMCLFFKLVSSLFLQIFPPNLELTFLSWCSAWHFCTFVEAACPKQNFHLFLNSHLLLLLIGEQEHDNLECRVAQVASGKALAFLKKCGQTIEWDFEIKGERSKPNVRENGNCFVLDIVASWSTAGLEKVSNVNIWQA